MTDGILQSIQQLQFQNKSGAEALLIRFLRETYSPLVEKVELRPSALSLNSFNGFLTLSDGQQLFFKSHTESNTIINEYYNAKQLVLAGYPVINPVYSSTEVGKQVLIYELISSPSVFDVAWAIENGQSNLMPRLREAQHASDKQLIDIYLKTLEIQETEEAGKSPIHQLFYHRLTGGRFDKFYTQDGNGALGAVSLPGAAYTMREILGKKWVINDQEYSESIYSLVQRAVEVLYPFQRDVSIIGHGDAHNGNVFLVGNGGSASLLYFDPAFAGRHHPLLDLVKPLFHNVFAMWMYFPENIRLKLHIDLKVSGSSFVVTHDYLLPEVRNMFLNSKVHNVLIPLLTALRDQNTLRPNWREYLKLALFCCPLLTMNLSDPNKFPPEIALLGLSMAVEMGGISSGRRSYIDTVLDEIEDKLLTT